jgi:hypothetical protein
MTYEEEKRKKLYEELWERELIDFCQAITDVVNGKPSLESESENHAAVC